jgi:hypothetical protein
LPHFLEHRSTKSVSLGTLRTCFLSRRKVPGLSFHS